MKHIVDIQNRRHFAKISLKFVCDNNGSMDSLTTPLSGDCHAFTGFVCGCGWCLVVCRMGAGCGVGDWVLISKGNRELPQLGLA